jgi:hypothetical protein
MEYAISVFLLKCLGKPNEKKTFLGRIFCAHRERY